MIEILLLKQLKIEFFVMIERLNSLLNIFDVGDLKFFLLVAKKNLKNLLTLSIILSLLVLLISLNQEKNILAKQL